MRNSETRKTKTGAGDTSITSLLAQARNDERRGRAEVMAARLEKLAIHISRRQLTAIEAAELLHQEAERFQLEAQEVH